MWIVSRTLLAWVAVSAGFAVAAGFVAFVSLIGVVPRLAAITKTADRIPAYEISLALGLIIMNMLSLYTVDLSFIPFWLSEFILDAGGLFTGIFVGCLAGALTEVVNIIPIMARRAKLRKGFPYFVKAFALGKCVGAFIQLYIFR